MIPEYYGSYSLDIPVGTSTKRHVRLILIQSIRGWSMRDICPRTVPQQVRQDIIKSLIEFDTLAYTRDIIIADKHTRNIMLTKTGDERMYITVFINFGDVRFGRTGYYSHMPEIEEIFLPGTYVSPLLRWHQACLCASDFEVGWIGPGSHGLKRNSGTQLRR